MEFDGVRYIDIQQGESVCQAWGMEGVLRGSAAAGGNFGRSVDPTLDGYLEVNDGSRDRESSGQRRGSLDAYCNDWRGGSRTRRWRRRVRKGERPVVEFESEMGWGRRGSRYSEAVRREAR